MAQRSDEQRLRLEAAALAEQEDIRAEEHAQRQKAKHARAVARFNRQQLAARKAQIEEEQV